MADQDGTGSDESSSGRARRGLSIRAASQETDNLAAVSPLDAGERTHADGLDQLMSQMFGGLTPEMKADVVRRLEVMQARVSDLQDKQLEFQLRRLDAESSTRAHQLEDNKDARSNERITLKYRLIAGTVTGTFTLTFLGIVIFLMLRHGGSAYLGMVLNIVSGVVGGGIGYAAGRAHRKPTTP